MSPRAFQVQRKRVLRKSQRVTANGFDSATDRASPLLREVADSAAKESSMNEEADRGREKGGATQTQTQTQHEGRMGGGAT